MKGGARPGSGRKRGQTDGRRQITVRIKAEVLEQASAWSGQENQGTVERVTNTLNEGERPARH
jgi:hypothetical protein